MEQNDDMPFSSGQVFEDSLPQDRLDSLKTVLDAEELKSLPNKGETAVINEGSMLWAFIPRGESIQKLVLVDLKGSPQQ